MHAFVLLLPVYYPTVMIYVTFDNNNVLTTRKRREIRQPPQPQYAVSIQETSKKDRALARLLANSNIPTGNPSSPQQGILWRGLLFLNI